MSTQYKKASDVPTETLTKRLDEIATDVTKAHAFLKHMQAEYDRDANLVIAEASDRLTALTRQRDRLAAGLLRIKQMCQPNTLYHEVAIKTLADAGMEIK